MFLGIETMHDSKRIHEVDVLKDKMTDYIFRSAKKAFERFAFDEARVYFEKILEIPASLENGEKRLIETRVRLGDISVAAGEWEKALNHYQTALELSEELEEEDLRAVIK